ncbi:Hibernation-specific plasma protein HP-55 CM55-ML Hibernator-specific blood complex, 55 kDa subunit [Collichthys lucidus]|uniref:Thyroxine-binding globulin n=1 Tax=Collichthys lucidus TaxID=240159 RepID=A0A4U5UV15_COLLU|nr:Hibernation-specific plasma protein HP-55 CM55-ML Hibernator-specific blood complex, 55 kDa subunit [Collichthys lucidus]
MMHAALGIWILAAVICVGRGDHHHGDQDTALDNSANSVSLVAAANREFAYRLYSQLAAHADSQGKNIFFSPSSVSVALATLSVGAREETHKQIFSGLGFNSTLLTQADVNQAFHALLEKANKTSGEDTSEGTAVFVDDNFKPRPEFLETLKQSYHADGFTVDFANAADSANTINEYVKGKTNGKIEELVSNPDPMTVMYLISYIYYKGKWATPFEPKLTKEDTFTVDENTKVQVQMMNKEKRFDIYYDQAINTSVLHLPFNSSYSMLLMLPDDMATLEKAICPSHVTRWLKWMKSRMYDVYIPKFSIKTSYTLNDVLTAMGMADMFTERADLSGIAQDQKLTVSEVVHQATLDVDEAGATAAAATGIGITLMSFRHVPVLKFDRPFMVMIIERNTEDILFMGKIVNPKI